ncbi:MAG: hypothetical protein K9K64_06465 [Desulfohalobiaceae bacterium]|nr:hypothetical protein [Desulfohalobiaceae bacterium]
MAPLSRFKEKLFPASLIRGKILDLTLLGFSIVIGLLAAVGALVFRFLIEFFQTLFWKKGCIFLKSTTSP